MEDLWLATTCQRHLQDIEAELRVKAVAELLAEHVSGEQIHDRHQVEESFLKREIGDVRWPNLIHFLDLLEVHQSGKSLEWLAWPDGAGFLVRRPKPHAAHEVSHPIAADRDAYPGQVLHQPAATAAGILQAASIDPGHDAQH